MNLEPVGVVQTGDEIMLGPMGWTTHLYFYVEVGLGVAEVPNSAWDTPQLVSCLSSGQGR